MRESVLEEKNEKYVVIWQRNEKKTIAYKKTACAYIRGNKLLMKINEGKWIVYNIKKWNKWLININCNKKN